MKKTILAVGLATAMTGAMAQLPPPGTALYTEIYNSCEPYGQYAVKSYEMHVKFPRSLDKLRGDPIADRAIDSMQAGRVSNEQAAYRIGIAHCMDWLVEQARK